MESTESPFTIVVVLYASISDLGVTRSSEHLRFPFFFRSSMFANSMAIKYYLIALFFQSRYSWYTISHPFLSSSFFRHSCEPWRDLPEYPSPPAPDGTRPRRGGIPCAGLCARDSSVRTTLHFLAQPPAPVAVLGCSLHL